MAYLNGNMNIMRFVTRENEAPRYKGIFPLPIDSVGGEVSEWYLYGNKNGVGEKQIVNGNLPLNFVSDGTTLENYRVYGTAQGAGVQTENYGYKIPLTVKNSTETKTIDVYIGDSKLGEEEYVDYGEQKIYKRILFMTHDDKHFITKDNKDFCLRRRGYSD